MAIPDLTIHHPPIEVIPAVGAPGVRQHHCLSPRACRKITIGVVVLCELAALATLVAGVVKEDSTMSYIGGGSGLFIAATSFACDIITNRRRG